MLSPHRPVVLYGDQPQGWTRLGAAAGIQALPDGQDSGGKTGVLSTPIPGYVLHEPSSDLKFFMNLINRGREEAANPAQPVGDTGGLSVLDTCRRSTLSPPSTE